MKNFEIGLKNGKSVVVAGTRVENFDNELIVYGINACDKEVKIMSVEGFIWCIEK